MAAIMDEDKIGLGRVPTTYEVEIKDRVAVMKVNEHLTIKPNTDGAIDYVEIYISGAHDNATLYIVADSTAYATITARAITLADSAAMAQPDAGFAVLYCRNDKLYYKDDGGVEREIAVV